MANLHTAISVYPRPNRDTLDLLYKQAEAENDWEILKPYPMLLFMWQMNHKDSMMDIAQWVSHFRRNHACCAKKNCDEYTYLNGYENKKTIALSLLQSVIKSNAFVGGI